MQSGISSKNYYFLKVVWDSPIIAMVIFAIAFIIGVVLIMKNNNEMKEG